MRYGLKFIAKSLINNHGLRLHMEHLTGQDKFRKPWSFRKLLQIYLNINTYITNITNYDIPGFH